MALMDLINDESKLESINLEMRDQYVQTGYEVKEEEFVEREDSKAVIAAEVKAKLLSKDEILQKAKDSFGGPDKIPKLPPPQEETVRRVGETERSSTSSSRFGWSAGSDTSRYSGRSGYGSVTEGVRKPFARKNFEDLDPVGIVLEETWRSFVQETKKLETYDDKFLNRKRHNPKSTSAKIERALPKNTKKRKIALFAAFALVSAGMALFLEGSQTCVDEVKRRKKEE